MKLYCKDNILMEDLEYIAQSKIQFSEYRNKNFLITGATGFIGSLIIKALLYCNEGYDLKIKIFAVIRNEEKAKSIFGDNFECSEISYVKCDLLNTPLSISHKVDYVIHTASITNSKTMVEYPVETIKTSVLGTMNVLEFVKDNNIKKMLYVSSMEVYGTMENEEATTEDKLGKIDLSSVRSSYSESKRLCELLCMSYGKEYGIENVNVRLAQVFGAGILPGENRVFAQFARSVMNGQDIVLKTKGNSEGNYCYSRDAILALFILLIKGKTGETYNVSNEDNHMTIYEMARLVADDVALGKIQVKIEETNENLGYAPDVKLKLDASKMRALGWKPEMDQKHAYIRLIESMKMEGIE